MYPAPLCIHSSLYKFMYPTRARKFWDGAYAPCWVIPTIRLLLGIAHCNLVIQMLRIESLAVCKDNEYKV